MGSRQSLCGIWPLRSDPKAQLKSIPRKSIFKSYGSRSSDDLWVQVNWGGCLGSIEEDDFMEHPSIYSQSPRIQPFSLFDRGNGLGFWEAGPLGRFILVYISLTLLNYVFTISFWVDSSSDEKIFPSSSSV